MARRRRKIVPRLSRLFQKAVRYTRCNNYRRLFDLLRRHPELINHVEQGETWLSGRTLLSAEVVNRRSSNIDIVEQLLRLGADPNLVQEGATTPLIQAAANNDASLAQLLLDFGADIDKTNDDLETPLGYACTWEAVEVVRLLCERGADINGTEGWGASYLWYVQCAVERHGPHSKHAEIERILISFGAKVIQEEPKLRFDESLRENVRVESGPIG